MSFNYDYMLFWKPSHLVWVNLLALVRWNLADFSRLLTKVGIVFNHLYSCLWIGESIVSFIDFAFTKEGGYWQNNLDRIQGRTILVWKYVDTNLISVIVHIRVPDFIEQTTFWGTKWKIYGPFHLDSKPKALIRTVNGASE